jgi:hypothetical protein
LLEAIELHTQLNSTGKGSICGKVEALVWIAEIAVVKVTRQN